MMSSFLPFLILCCMLCKTIVAQVLVSADKTSPKNGEAVMLTCRITSFSVPASWIKHSTSGILSICPAAGPCSVITSGRYSFSATASTIVAQISSYNSLIDNFGWKCQHDTDIHVFRFTLATTATTRYWSAPPTATTRYWSAPPTATTGNSSTSPNNTGAIVGGTIARVSYIAIIIGGVIVYI